MPDLRSQGKRKASLSEVPSSNVPLPNSSSKKNLKVTQQTQGRPHKRSKADLKQEAANERLAEKARVQAEKDAKEAADIKVIASIEDSIRREQKEEQAYAERPDLRTFENLQQAPSPPPYDHPDAMDIDHCAASKGADDIPEDSDSDGLALGEQAAVEGSESDASENKSTFNGNTSDGLISDEESRAEYLKLKAAIAKKKAKRAKGALRSAVTDKRKVKPSAPFTAKPSDGADGDEEIVGAAKKKSPLEGFRKGFDKPPRAVKPRTQPSKTASPIRQSKAALSRTTSTARGSSTAQRVTEPKTPGSDEELEGFQDEAPVAIAAARLSKATVLSQKSGTSKMGIKIEKVEISDNLKKEAVPSRKPGVCTKDLPLGNVPNGIERWRRQAMPIVYAWASTLLDPFAINSDPAFDGVLREAWEDVFEGEAEFTGVVSQVAGAAIRTWRSSMGRLAVDIVSDYLKGPDFSSGKARAKYVRDQLNECRYVYEDPLKMEGAYRAPLLLQVYAYHQAKIELTDVFYGHPVGALAFAATALERALTLWKTVTLVDTKERKNFVNRPWGARVEYHVGTLRPFSNSRWSRIEYATKPFVKAAKAFKEDDGNTIDEGINLSPDVVIHLSESEDEGGSDISKDL